MKRDDIILYFILVYIVFFGFFSLLERNTEFFYYSIVFFFCFFILSALHKRVRFPAFLLLMIAVYGLMHFIGGLFSLHDYRIYDLHFFIIGYDNVVHTIAAFILTVLGYSILEPGLNDMIKGRRVYFGLLLVLFGFGIASFGEIVELIGVILFNVHGVGNYLNNAWDLVYNFIGATIGSIIVVRHHWQKDIFKLKQ